MQDPKSLDPVRQPDCERCGQPTPPAFRGHTPIYELYTNADTGAVEGWHAPRFLWLCYRCQHELQRTISDTDPPGAITADNFARHPFVSRRGRGGPSHREIMPEFDTLYRSVQSALRHRLRREPYQDELIDALSPAMGWSEEGIDERTFLRWLGSFDITYPPTRRP